MDSKAHVSQVVIVDKDGKVYYLGDINDKKLHGETALDFISMKYPNNVEFSQLSKGSPKADFGYHLGNMGNVTYFNEGSFGVIYLPNDVNEVQIDKIYSLGIDDQIVMLNYNPTDLGFILYESIGINNDCTFKEVMGEYLNLNKGKGHHR